MRRISKDNNILFDSNLVSPQIKYTAEKLTNLRLSTLIKSTHLHLILLLSNPAT